MRPAVLDIIRTRGHWWCDIRPTVFDPKRLRRLDDLPDIVRTAAVLRRGWDFPHIDPHTPIGRYKDYVQQETNWHHHKEFFRLYQSGQFVFAGGFWEDWWDENVFQKAGSHWRPGADLSVEGALYTFTEMFEFATRLALNGVFGDSVYILIRLNGLQGRQLFLAPNRAPGLWQASQVSDHEAAEEYPREKLIADSASLAREWAGDLFGRFGWSATPDVLRDIQGQLGRG